MKILVMIPAYNEEANIVRVVENLRKNFAQYDYVVINDGSKDHTAQLCRSHGYSLINLPVNLGLAGAFQAGLRYADENNYDMAIQLDGDGQHDPSYIAKMIAEMTTLDCDVVIGSRYKDKKKPATLRMLGNELIQAAIQLTTGVKVSDPTSGMRLYNRKMITRLAHNLNYGPEPDTISYLLRCGARVSEVQVEMQDRTAGVSYLNFTRSIIYMLNMCTSILFIQYFRKREV